jgi:hypothetical protein
VTAPANARPAAARSRKSGGIHGTIRTLGFCVLVGQDVRKPHERDQRDQLGRRVAQTDLAALPPGGELKPAKRIHRHRVGLDAADVTASDTAATLAQQGADTVTEPGNVLPHDRSVYGKVNCLRR